MTVRRPIVLAGAAGGLAVALLLGGAVLGSPTGAPAEERSGAAAVAAAAPGSVEALQERLRRVPGDYPAWAGLALRYVDLARTTGDPSYYGRAQEAVDRSLAVREGNDPGLTALATLQAAQHRFADAETSARRALAVNDFSASAYGVLTDALVEQGRYDESAEALQRMADLDPSFPALARVSYARELRGDVEGARVAMQRALDTAGSAQDEGFALHHLGELAVRYGGDLEAAVGLWRRGLERDPESVPLQAALARAAAAQGRTDEALQGWEAVTGRLPTQEHLVGYGELLLSLGRDEQAQEQFALVRTANRLLEDSGSVVDLETAVFEADHGTPEAALAAAEAAYARGATVFAEDAMAWALHAAGRDEEALVHADAALALGVRPASFLYHRGVIAAALGRADQARADLQASLEQDPWSSPLQVQRVRAALAALG